MQNVLNLWRMRNITLQGKIIIFKTLALSKIVYLTLITSFSKQLIEEIQKIQKAFIWNNLTPKIKHETLCNYLEESCFKNVDIYSKIASSQCSQVKQLYDDKFHEWKLISLHLIKCPFGIDFKFHSNLDLTIQGLLDFLHFVNNFSVIGASIFLPVLTFHLLYYHNQFDNKKNYQKLIHDVGKTK